MKLSYFKTEITKAILAERERCAKLAEAELHPLGDIVAEKIRAARRPVFRIVRPETVVKQPELLKEDIIIAGQEPVVAMKAQDSQAQDNNT